MSNLRQEIIKSFKLRADFIKWKLLIVSILAATGLGLTGNSNSDIQNAYLILVLIPLVCLFVDLLCKHNSLRILVIGAFKRTIADGEEYKYEQFAEACGRRNVFSLEEYAISGFTYAASVITILIGFCFFDSAHDIWLNLLKDTAFPEIFKHHSSGILFIASGLAAIILTRIFNGHFEEYRKSILEEENKFKRLQR